MSRRLERVAKRLKQELGGLMSQLRHPDIGFVTVTKVEPSADLRVAKVYVSFLPTRGHEDPQASLEALRHSAGFLQSNLGNVLRTKTTPELRFYLDQGIERSAHMSELLREANADEGGEEGEFEPSGDEELSSDG